MTMGSRKSGSRLYLSWDEVSRQAISRVSQSGYFVAAMCCVSVTAAGYADQTIALRLISCQFRQGRRSG